jgi:FAD/FMN-containing dehydrogenase
MAGGAVGPGLILDVSGLRQLGTVDSGASTIRCGPGVLREEVEAVARRHGLRFPVDPSSGTFCTIGGMAATNAAGAHALGFGAMHVWVEALECVLADGSAVTLRRGVPPPPGVPAIDRALAVLQRCRAEQTAFQRSVRKDSSGYAIDRWLASGDLLDVIIGSEGTLAIITGVELRLAPLPHATTSLLAAFPDLETASDGARAAREAGAVVCELLDATFLELAGSAFQSLPADAAAVLLVELEGGSPTEARTRAVALELDLGRAGARATTLALVPDAERELWELRHAASPALAKLDPALRSVQVIEDGAVPPESLADYVKAVRAELTRLGVRSVIFGHAGDAHVHVNPLVDVTSDDWKPSLETLLETVTAEIVRLGGTLSGEHGDGRLRAPLLGQTRAPGVVQAFQQLKAAFDPDGILNPGVKLPLTGQRPLEDVKYDPRLPPLPAAARAALDRVAELRMYATPRLSLLDGGS